MLNLSIAMLTHKKSTFLLLIAPWFLAQLLYFPGRPDLLHGSARPAAAPTATVEIQPGIRSPGPGEALQGIVTVAGTTDIPGFRSMEVAFAYQADPTGTWFLLQQSDTPVKERTLSSWDTTTITDGIYQLRLRVFLQDGQVIERKLEGLRVRNYTAIETSTPKAIPSGQPTLTPTSTPRTDFQPTPGNATPQPTNPVQITARHLEDSALRGTLVVFGAALLGMVYIGIRAIARR